jgi:hypothetical protein
MVDFYVIIFFISFFIGFIGQILSYVKYWKNRNFLFYMNFPTLILIVLLLLFLLRISTDSCSGVLSIFLFLYPFFGWMAFSLLMSFIGLFDKEDRKFALDIFLIDLLYMGLFWLLCTICTIFADL